MALLLLFLETRLGELPILRTEEGKKRWEQENMLMIAPNSPAIFFQGNAEREKRSGYERRRFHYDAHIPERRGRIDRRNGTNGCVQESLNKVAAAR